MHDLGSLMTFEVVAEERPWPSTSYVTLIILLSHFSQQWCHCGTNGHLLVTVTLMMFMTVACLQPSKEMMVQVTMLCILRETYPTEFTEVPSSSFNFHAPIMQ